MTNERLGPQAHRLMLLGTYFNHFGVLAAICLKSFDCINALWTAASSDSKPFPKAKGNPQAWKLQDNSKPCDAIRLLLLFSTSLGLTTPQITDTLKRYHCHLLSCNSNIQLWLHFVSTQHVLPCYFKRIDKWNKRISFPAASTRNINKINI